MKEYYFKVTSLCRLRKSTPIVQSLDIGTAENPEVLHTDEEIEQHLSSQIRKEFEDGKNYKVKYDIGTILPVEMDEFEKAIKLIKLDKATSFDCTPDSIIKHIMLSTDHPDQVELIRFKENYLKIINDCLINKTIPS